MPSPLDQLIGSLEDLARDGTASVARRAAAPLREAAQAAAPVRSGALRESLTVTPEAGGLRIRSPLPYAQRHPELIPDQAEAQAILEASLLAELDPRLRGR